MHSIAHGNEEEKNTHQKLRQLPAGRSHAEGKRKAEGAGCGQGSSRREGSRRECPQRKGDPGRPSVQIVRPVLHLPRPAMQVGASQPLHREQLRASHQAHGKLHEFHLQSLAPEIKEGGGGSEGSPRQGKRGGVPTVQGDQRHRLRVHTHYVLEGGHLQVGRVEHLCSPPLHHFAGSLGDL